MKVWNSPPPSIGLVTAILLNGWILPTGGVALGRVCTAAWAAGLLIYILRRMHGIPSLETSDCIFVWIHYIYFVARVFLYF